jgi:ATP-dependent RNA helicase RhlE
MSLPATNLPINDTTPPETTSTVSFKDFGLDEKILAALEELNFTNPTPIQAQAIPVALKGGDIMGLAHTGTGKTAAFALPMLHRLLTTQGRGIRALIVAPTRELVEQITSVICDLGQKTRIRATTIYGGASMGRQMAELRRKPEIVVACPGRLLDHVQRGTIDLSTVELLVLDEADQMFDMGFLPGIKKIISYLPNDYQSMLFSATMPDSIKQLATDMMTKPQVVKVNSATASAPSVAHHAYVIQADQKTPALLKLISEERNDTVLVFTRTKHGAKKLAEKISREGHASAALHGNLSQSQRLTALKGFRQGRFRILVATDVAARGLDVSGIGRVINFDLPETVESYIHRSGRTGRASEEGRSLSLVTPDDAGIVRSIERTLKSRIVRCPLEGFTSEELERFIETAPGAAPRRRGGGGGAPRGGNRGGFAQRRSGPGAGDSRGRDFRDGGSRDGNSRGNGYAPRGASSDRPGQNSGPSRGSARTERRSGY